MSSSRSLLFNTMRVVLAVLIGVANISVFAASSPKDARGCYTCVKKEGGSLGFYVDCVFGDTGQMSTCLEGLTECYGYPCMSGEAPAEAEIEGAPTQFTALAK